MSFYLGGILLSALLGWLWDQRPEDWLEQLGRGARKAAPYVGGALGGPAGAALGSYAALPYAKGQSAFTSMHRPGLQQDFGYNPYLAGLGGLGLANDMDLNRRRMFEHMMRNDRQQFEQSRDLYNMSRLSQQEMDQREAELRLGRF